MIDDVDLRKPQRNIDYRSKAGLKKRTFQSRCPVFLRLMKRFRGTGDI